MPSPLRGRRVVITAGPTREHMDPVRFMTNASSGEMGFALARAARRRGARVTVVTGAPPPRDLGDAAVRVTSALEMRRETLKRVKGAALVIGAAAVSDWRFESVSRHKLKRAPGPVRLTMIPNPDIIRDAAALRRPGQVFVGFALETRRAAAHARKKLETKGLDLVVANGPSSLASGRIKAILVGRRGTRALPGSSKAVAARTIIAEAERLIEQGA